jgi:molybdopterin-binding protein
VRITSGLDITHTLLRSTAAAKITRAERRPAARRSVTDHPEDKIVVAHSARNRFGGLVTRVVRDTVMAQVEIQTGPHRFVSLLSREVTDKLGVEPGMLVIVAVNATNVSVEIPQNR